MLRATPRAVSWLERHQLVLYLAAIAGGFALGALWGGATRLEALVNPTIGLLLYVTFLGVPFGEVGRAFRDRRFLVTLLVLNFVAVPAAVFALSRFVAHDHALLLGVLLVLLTPCVDYVIVFSGLAGAATEKLLAATPLLMLAQLLLLPAYLLAFAGPSTLEVIDVAPFAEAFLMLILVPLALAALTQWGGRRLRGLGRLESAAAASMVPVMLVALSVVVASQAQRVLSAGTALLAAVPIFVAFAVVAVGLGLVAARIARLDAGASRAVVFSGVTRNSLVVLPLAVALPESLALAPAVVVTQTLVELLVLVVLIRAVPRLVRAS